MIEEEQEEWEYQVRKIVEGAAQASEKKLNEMTRSVMDSVPNTINHLKRDPYDLLRRAPI